MKSLNIFLAVILIVIVTLSCKDSGTNPNVSVSESASEYYPGGLNSTFTFRYDTLNDATSSFDSVGFRNSVFSELAESGGSENIVQTNIQNVEGNETNSALKIRRTNAGIYFLIDTLDVQSLLELLPDSLKDSFEFSIDSEIIALSTPLQQNKIWSAFKAIVTIKDFGISLTILEVKVYYEGEEEIFIEADNTAVTGKKLRYEFILKLPDPTSTDIGAILNPPTTIFNAAGWFVKNIGLVKLEGNSFLINSLSSGSLNLADTSGIARESLTNYELK